jgi:hypothetical protein
MRKLNPLKPQLSSISMWGALIVFIILVFTTLVSILESNNGVFAYTIDDVYIHMAMAKNFSQSGVWGVTRYEFSSTSSSISYTLLLSVLYSVFGINDYLPFVINFLSGIALIIFVDNRLMQNKIPFAYRFLIILLIIVCTPLIPIMFTGMEHIMHALLTIIFVDKVLLILLNNPETTKIDKKQEIMLLCIAILLASTRYESLLIIGICVFLCILKKKILIGFKILLVSALPIVIYGFISTAQGWYFFPNSIILRSYMSSFNEVFDGSQTLPAFLEAKILNLITQTHLYILIGVNIVLIAVQYKKEVDWWNKNNILGIIFIGSAFLHAIFAEFGYFYRYEGYLMVFGLYTLGILVFQIFNDKSDPDSEFLTDRELISAVTKSIRKKKNKKSNVASRSENMKKTRGILIGVFLITIVLLPSFIRGVNAYEETSEESSQVYGIHYHMAQFLNKYYTGEKVAANDIGAINYYADIQCFDLVGLGSLEPAQLLQEEDDFVGKLFNLTESENVKIAVIISYLFPPWTLVARWMDRDEPGRFISFYAVDTNETTALKSNLIEYSSQLPESVLYIKYK